MRLDEMKVIADKMREPVIQTLLLKDEAYQKECESEQKSEQEYLSLNLTDEERAICDSLLRSLDARWMEYASDSYLAGMMNALSLHQHIS